jgi:small subunit ribosomal protein S8
MTMSDPLGDMLTRIRNGQRRRKDTVVSPASRFSANVLDVLVREGYIRGYEREPGENGRAEIKIELKYYDGQAVIKRIWRISKPGCRVYSSIGDLPRIQDGLGISIVSTPRGVMSDTEARVAKVGGEVLCGVI